MFAGEVEPRSSTHKGVSVSQVRATSPSPLERRASLCELCADGGGSGRPNEPRKSFMKFWVTDAIQFRETESRLCSPVYARARKRTPAPTNLFLFRFAILRAVNIDFPFEVRTFFNGNAARGNVAGDHRRFSQFDLLAGLHISLQLALRTDGQAVAFQSDGSFHLAIDVEVFAARQFPFDDDRLANLRQFARQLCTHGNSPR